MKEAAFDTMLDVIAISSRTVSHVPKSRIFFYAILAKNEIVKPSDSSLSGNPVPKLTTCLPGSMMRTSDIVAL